MFSIHSCYSFPEETSKTSVQTYSMNTIFDKIVDVINSEDYRGLVQSERVERLYSTVLVNSENDNMIPAIEISSIKKTDNTVCYYETYRENSMYVVWTVKEDCVLFSWYNSQEEYENDESPINYGMLNLSC